MARQFESRSKGWRPNLSKHIGRLEAIERFPTYQSDKIKTTTDDDECIYYPLVYGQEEKLKIIVNPQDYEQYKKSQSNSQSPLMKNSMKENKSKSYGTDDDDDGCYEFLRGSTVVQSSPPSRHHNRARHDLPVSQSVLRALNNDFHQNKDRVMTLEPSKVTFHQVNLNNNYEQPKNGKKASRHFVDDDLNERGNSETLLDCCTCMCCVKGAFYHFTKDCDDEGQIADQPCSCAGPSSQCVPRWGCLGIFALFLPCLWCYLPAKGCMNLHRCSLDTQNNEVWK